ncbi:MAG: hypothetical protein H7338_15135, partial [Candidatus Sericytochromatia bacterium]|nr:hypothetical protein [Candidatus Sericytochromatia bacterium]
MTKVMTKTLIAVLAAAPMLAACPAGIPGTTPGASTLNITGNVIKGTVPFENATVRLIEKINNVTSNREVRQADKQGNFTFEKVPGGTYRVAFDRANLAEVKDKATVYHQAGSDTYGFYTTTEFVIMGSEGSRTIPPMNVAWTPNLSPSVDGSAKAPVTFSWNAAPDAKSYKVRIASSTNNT